MLLTTIVLVALMLPLGKVHAAEVTPRQDQAAGNASASVQAAEGASEGAHLGSKTPSQGLKTPYGKHFGLCARTRNAQRLSARLGTRPGGGR